MTVRDAFRHVKSIRPVICPNLAFLEQLVAYEEKIMKRKVAHMVEHTVNGITKRLPDFIIAEYWAEYAIEFDEEYNKLNNQ